MRKTGIILSFIIFSVSALADGPDIYFSGDFRNASFNAFVREVELQSGAHFFYKDDWVSGITVTATGDGLSLVEILNRHLTGKQLYYYVDEKNNVFITPETIHSFKMPDHRSPGDSLERDEPVPGNELMQTDRQYIEGRTTGIAETITIGKENEGQTGSRMVINGKIWDLESGEPMIGATVYLEELQTGAVTDINGYYNMVIPPGKYSMVAACMGMKEVRYFLQVYSSGQLNIPMVKKIIPIHEVVVKADQFHNVRGIQMGYERIDIKTMKEIPVVMGEKDVLKVMQMLPGIQSVGEGSSGINVRGSPADQNMFSINKVPVYNPSHLFGFFSSFSPDIVRDLSVYKSNVPAKYGGRLASFFDVSTRQGNKKKFTGRGGISPVTGHVAVEGPIRKDRSSFVLSARSTYSDWLLSRFEDPDLRNSHALFYDLSANINVEPSENNLFKAFAYYSYDRFALASTNKYQYTNLGGSLSWRHRFLSTLTAELVAIFGSYSFQTDDHTFEPLAYKHDYKIDHHEIKSDQTWFLGQKQTVTFGGNVILYDLNRGNVLPEGPESIRLPVSLGTEQGLEGAIYIADEIKILPGLTFYGGFRFSFFGLLGPDRVHEYYPDVPKDDQNIKDTIIYPGGKFVKTYGGPGFRTALNLRTGDNSSLKASYNRIHQFLFMLSNTIALSPTDQWKLCDYHIIPPYADQVSAGFYKDFPMVGINTSVEAYYKKTHNTVDFKDGASFVSKQNTETEILQGDQTSYGVELLVRKNVGKLNGWISYAYSRSEVLIDGRYPWEKANLGYSYPANYDKPHSLSLVGNYRINRRLSFSTNLVYSTGRPITYPISIYYMNNQPVVNYSLRNEYRIPDYFRMDFSINFEGNLKARKIAHSYWMINIYNLTGRRNAYSVFFRSEEGKINAYRMSIFATPIITISWNFKLGNYANE